MAPAMGDASLKNNGRTLVAGAPAGSPPEPAKGAASPSFRSKITRVCVLRAMSSNGFSPLNRDDFLGRDVA